MTALVRYEQMRVAVEQCARIDEASELRDKAAALQAYARQRDDRDLEVWTSEIKLRASVRIGELVRELDTAPGARTELRPTTETKLKDNVIADAGLSRSAAYRMQELAGPREEILQAAGKAAAETYFAKARADREPATADGLKAAVKDAVHAAKGGGPVLVHNHRAQGTGENEWYTPAQYIEAVRALMGEIDLDPASSEIANRTVKAAQFHSMENDGLEAAWRGRVWLNPPYAQPWIAKFMEKLRAEIREGNTTQAVALTHNYTDTAWFQRTAEESSAICFTRGRIGFLSPDGTRAAPTQGQAFFYFGPDVGSFKSCFEKFGLVLVRA